MKSIGKNLKEFVVGAAAIALVGSIAYTGFALASKAIQDNYLHDFRGTVQVREIKIDYEGVEPYDPFPPFPWHEHNRNGHAKVMLRGNERVFLRYENLTLTSLEGRIWVKNSKGEGAEFDEKTKYNGKTLEDVSELKEALESAGSDKSIRDVVEQKIKDAIAKK